MWGKNSNMTPEQLASVKKSLTVSAAFAFTSVATSFTFKAIFSTYKFEASFTLLGLQMFLTLLFCLFLKTNCKRVKGLEVPDIKQNLVQDSLIAGILFVTNIAVGFAGLKRVNIPMFLTVRRTTTVFTLVAEYFVLGKVASRTITIGIALSVLGALVAGADSLSSDIPGYLWTLGNNAATAASWSATKRFSDTHGIKGFGLTMYNALVAFPLCIIAAYVTGEFSYVWSYPHLTDFYFLCSLLFATTLGVAMNYVVFLCTTSTSPLATAVTGNVKDIGATVLGAWLFGDFIPSSGKVLGILISFIGSGIFSVAKLAEARGGGGGGSSSSSNAASGSGVTNSSNGNDDNDKKNAGTEGNEDTETEQERGARARLVNSVSSMVTKEGKSSEGGP